MISIRGRIVVSSVVVHRLGAEGRIAPIAIPLRRGIPPEPRGLIVLLGRLGVVRCRRNRRPGRDFRPARARRWVRCLVIEGTANRLRQTQH
jgi:hypothetical protein